MTHHDHVIRRFDPRRPLEFDEQFWPVVVAMSVLAALTIGTVITVSEGPWMWFSLLALPAAVAISLVLLYRVERRWLRRSVQTALILSLAAHLLILIVAYGSRIFSNPRPTRAAVTRTVTPERHLEISSQQTEQFWEQPNEIETPEPEVEVERETTPPESSEPLIEPLPNAAAETAPSPPLERRENPAETTPKAGASLSRASRQPEAEAPQARAATVSESAPARAQPNEARQPEPSAAEVQPPQRSETTQAVPLKAVAPEPEPRTAEVRDRARREEPARQQVAAAATPPRRETNTRVEPTAPAATSAPAANQPARDVAPADTAVARAEAPATLRKSVPSESTTPQAAASEVARRSSSDATTAAPQRVSRSEPLRSPRAPAATSLPTDAPSALARSESTITPSTEAARLTRQSTPSEIVATTSRVSETESRTRENSVARARNPSESPATTPSLTPAATNRPRLTAETAATPRTTDPAVSPSPAAASNARAETAPSAQPLALQRARGGTAGEGSAANFGRAPDSSPSPALTAMDSSTRSRAASRDPSLQALSPSPQARVARATAGAAVPEHSVQATAEQAPMAGSRQPSELVASSAAALTAASAPGERGENSLEKGSADVDVGPTKIAGSTSRREESAGGGQPDLSNVQAALGSKESGGEGLEPRIDAGELAASTAAPADEGSSAPRADQATPSAESSVTRREGGEQSEAAGISRSEVVDEALATSSLAPSNAAPAANARAENASQGDEGESEWEDEEEQRRRARTARDVAVDGLAANEVEASSTTPAQASGNPDALEGLANSAVVERSQQVSASGLERSTGSAAADPQPQVTAVGSGERAERSAERQLASEQRAASGARREATLLDTIEPSGFDGPELAEGQDAASQARDLVDAQGVAVERSSGRQSTSLGRTQSRTPATTDAPGFGQEFGSRNEGAAEPASAALAAASGSRTATAALEVDALATPPASQRDGAGQSTQSANLADNLAPATRSEQAGMRIEIDRETGAGGLADLPEREIGVNSRRASPESDQIAHEPSRRFLQRDPSGSLSAPAPSSPTPSAFAGRNPGNLPKSGPQTEAAIEAGLAFLARYQGPDGRWSLLGFDENDPAKQFQLDSDSAATGLAVLAFQGAGYTHREYKYETQVARGIGWLIQHQADDGNLYIASDEVSNNSCLFYSHAIATLALAEAFGMTQDPDLREPIERAVAFLEKTQDPVNGGWRYFPNPQHPDPRFRASSDTSVTGWVVTALHSARLAGIEVAPQTWEGIDRWLAVAHAADNESLFRYNPYAPDIDKQRAGRDASLSMTAVGLLMRMYTGWDRDDQRLIAGARELLRQLPGESNGQLRDTYYWYYATQVLRHVDGDAWAQWNEVLHPLLIQSQQSSGSLAGSWHPYYPVEDRWGKNGGRLYVTAMNLLSLEVDYRLLPLYEKTTLPRASD